MSTLTRILTWPIRPIQSERAATSLAGAAIISYFVFVGYKLIKGTVPIPLAAVLLLLVLVGFPYAGLSLISRARTRAYRDNTGSRAACELVGLGCLFCFFIIAHPLL